MQIRLMTPDDWVSVSRIYREGIESRLATFETTVPEWDAWDKKHLAVGRIVAETGQQVVGWAALSAVSARPVYRGVAEVSVYVGAGARGNGIGKALLGRLVEISEENGFWTLQASIFPHNPASLTLHERFGFRIVGRRERIAQLDGIWYDTIIMERRSAAVGI